MSRRLFAALVVLSACQVKDVGPDVPAAVTYAEKRAVQTALDQGGAAALIKDGAETTLLVSDGKLAGASATFPAGVVNAAYAIATILPATDSEFPLDKALYTSRGAPIKITLRDAESGETIALAGVVTVSVPLATFDASQEERATLAVAHIGAAFDLLTPDVIGEHALVARTNAFSAFGSVTIKSAAPSGPTGMMGVTGPETTIIAGPSGDVATSSVSFEFVSDTPAATFECGLDSEAYVACASPYFVHGLAVGMHILYVRAVLGDVVDATPAAVVWSTVDVTAPETAIDSKPELVTSSRTAVFEFLSTEAMSLFKCQLDAQSEEDCDTGKTYQSLSDGEHSFSVYAIDASDNTDDSPATWTWRVDATPPQTTITSGPSGVTSATGFTYSFECDEPSCLFECSFTMVPLTPVPFSCDSPQTFNVAESQTYVFSVIAFDAVNADATPATRQIAIADSTPPSTTITFGPGATIGATSASFGFGCGGEVCTYECALTADAESPVFSQCVSPALFGPLTLGAKTFHVRAKDQSNNVDPSPTTRSFTVVPKDGQMGTAFESGGPLCYDDLAVISCPTGPTGFFGQDGSYPQSTQTFLDAAPLVSNGALRWEQQNLLSAGTIGSISSRFSLSQAQSYCASLASSSYSGFSSWRLPDVHELVQLYDFSATTLPYLSAAFNVETTVPYWTRSVSSNGDGLRLPFDGSLASNGASGFTGASALSPVRCVAEGTKGATGPTAAQDFVDRGDGTIAQEAAGLIWTKAQVGSNANWQGALNACNTLTTGGISSWRLPEIRELVALADYRRAMSTLDPMFTGNTTTEYWSSTTVAATPSTAWVVRARDGVLFSRTKSSSFAVRCVASAD